MFGFIKKVLVAATFFSCSLLKCVSVHKQESQIRSEIINMNSNEPLFYKV